MVFFDTCIWIELCAATTPITPKERRQASVASSLLSDVQRRGDNIVTCREQLFEIVSAIQKVKMKEHNKICKQNSVNGVGQLKEFKATQEFVVTQNLCRQAIQDVCHMASEKNIGECPVETVIDNIHLVDLNDYLYYEYCLSEGIDFYTFDGDFSKLEENDKIHII